MFESWLRIDWPRRLTMPVGTYRVTPPAKPAERLEQTGVDEPPSPVVDDDIARAVRRLLNL